MEVWFLSMDKCQVKHKNYLTICLADENLGNLPLTYISKMVEWRPVCMPKLHYLAPVVRCRLLIEKAGSFALDDDLNDMVR